MNKTDQLNINLEEPLAEAFRRLARKDGCSISNYGRRLIIEHLRNTGTLPDGELTRILAGVRG